LSINHFTEHVDPSPHLIHPSLNQPHSPPQTTFRFNQPYFHNSPGTERQTERPSEWQMG